MNIRELAEGLGFDEDEYLELFELFVDVGRTDLEELQSAVEGGDAKQVASAAHSLKGASGNLGFMELHDLAGKIVEKARNNQLEGVDESVQVLKKKFDSIAELTEE